MPTIKSDETLDIRGTLEAANAQSVNLKDGSLGRIKLIQEALVPIPIPLTSCRIWNNYALLLTNNPNNDDLGIAQGTSGTDAPTIQSDDAGGATVAQKLGLQFVLPTEYDDGKDIQLRIRAGMITTISDGTATVDVQAYLHDGDGSVAGDACTTAAQSINNLSKANKDFVITPTGVVSGDTFDVVVTVTIIDSGNAGVMLGEISRIDKLLDIKG